MKTDGGSRQPGSRVADEPEPEWQEWRPPWLERRAAATPSAEAIRWPGGSICYAELEACARACAADLDALGVRRGNRVAVHMPGGVAFAVLAHALQASGAVLVPLNLRSTAFEVSQQLEDCGAHWSIGLGDDVALPVSTQRLLLRGADSPAVRLEAPGASASRGRGAAAHPSGPPRAAPSPILRSEDPLALLFTSGTTGRARPAALSHRAFAASAAGHAALLGLEADDRWLACMPLFHVGGLAILWRSVLAGSAVLLHDGFDAECVANALAAGECTIVSLVPTMLARLLDVWGARGAPPRLRCALIGGASASEALLDRARRAGFPIAPTYGLTEAASQVATRPPQDDDPPHGTRLVPLPGTQVRIEDDASDPLPAGQPGSIALRGPTLMSGYVSPEPSVSPVGLDADGWFRTGDVGVLDAEGRLQVLDRRSDLIVSGGENIYPAEIEAVLLDHPAIEDAGVAGVGDAEFGARPVAWIVLVAGSPPPSAEALRAFCAERLARYKLPLRFERVDALPRNAAGKLQRGRLGALLGG